MFKYKYCKYYLGQTLKQFCRLTIRPQFLDITRDFFRWKKIESVKHLSVK